MKAFLLALLALALAHAAPACAQGYGPRAFQLVPEGSSVLTLYGLGLDGNQSFEPGQVIEGSDTEVTLGIAQYTRPFAVGGQQGALVVALPYGRIDASLDTRAPGAPALSASQSGLFDLQVALVFGLVGSPSMKMPEYAAWKPGFALGAMANVYAPLGSYDASRSINTGTNRWAMQLGLPMSFNFGSSLVSLDHGTIELLPAVTLFDDNGDPAGNAGSTGQRPLFTLEGHLTRNLNRMAWVSLDALYANGGAGVTDGRGDDDRQQSFSAGGSLNLTFSPAFSMKGSYGRVLSRNEHGPDGDMWRLMASYVF